MLILNFVDVKWIAPFALLCGATLVLPLPTAGAQNGDAVAIVNGKPITKQRINKVLMDAYGVEVMQQLIITELAKRESQRRELRVTRADLDAEFQDALRRIAVESGMSAEDASEENKMKALRTVLDQKRISMAEFMLGMERNAHLRKCVEQEFKPDEATLREEFARTHGEKVRVRHIQISIHNQRALSEVGTLLRRGADFADIARQKSENPETAPRGGELAPFTFQTPMVEPVLREAAFALAPGEISNPIRTDQYFHILKLEERIPPDDVRFESVRDQVEQDMRGRVVPEKMAELAATLFRKASVRVLDVEMRLKYQKFLNQSASRP